jgi:hypothetical protein
MIGPDHGRSIGAASMWHMGEGWGWWMAFGWIWMIVIVAVIAWAVLRLTERGGGRRYATGELSDEQYRRCGAD